MPPKKTQPPPVISSSDSEDDTSTRQFEDLKKFFSAELSLVRESIDSLTSEFQSFKDEVQVIKQEVTDIKTQQDTNSSEILKLKIQSNTQEQRDRARGMRIHDLILPTNPDPQQTVKCVYDNLILPAFIKAHADGVIDTVPPIYSTIEYGHVLSAPPSPPPGVPPTRRVIIVKFCTRLLKGIFLKYKKVIIDQYNQRNGTSTKAVDDLTRTNISAITRFKKNPAVHSVFFRGGSIQLSMKSDPEKLHRITNPFASDVNTAISNN